MKKVHVCLLVLWLIVPRCLSAEQVSEQRPEFRPQKGERIVFVGNTFAERLAMFGNFESLLHAKFPQAELTVRSMGWSADTPTLQPRPLNFGDMHTHLAEQQADIVFLCFGMNESFDGPDGLPKFSQELRDMVAAVGGRKYNGKTPARVVLVSPIPHERMGRHLPDPTRHNEQLATYTDAIRKVADDHAVPFVDVFRPLRSLMDAGAKPHLTINGIHLNQRGDWLVSQVMARALGILPEPGRLEFDARGRDGRLQFTFTNNSVGVPVASEKVDVALELPQAGETVVVRNLKPGRYSLLWNGQSLVTASSSDWAKGVLLSSGPAAQAGAELREAIVDKNQQFFYRWRAVNGEYIYGRRKEPFGVMNFPGEMKRLDEMIRERDQRIWYLAVPQPDQAFELVPAEK